MNRTLRIILLMLLIVIFGSISHISLPLVVSSYPSVFYVLFMTSIGGIIIYSSITIIRKYYVGIENQLSVFLMIFKKYIKLIALIGISNAFMSILMMYSANPTRTPVVIQSIFLGLAVLSSIVFSKCFLDKHIVYNIPYTIISILFLLGSVGIAIIPLLTESNESEFVVGWIFMFMFGVFAYSLTNVLQEKYLRESNDVIDSFDNRIYSFDNKIYLALASSICQFISIIAFSWIDIFIGYNTVNESSFESFQYSFNVMITDTWSCLWLMIFILLWFLLFIIALFLNELSTNYTMILTNITNQSIAIFFIIFPSLNHGLQYPLYITLSSLATSFISVLFWINAEYVIDDDVSDGETLNIVKS